MRALHGCLIYVRGQKMGIKRVYVGMYELTLMVTIFTLLQSYVFLLGVVPTESMYPNIPVGTIILATRDVTDVVVGDIIVFRLPELSQEYYIKRVIARPVDTVEVRGGELYVNGWEVNTKKEFGAIGNIGADFICVGDGEGYFVIGDNMSNSLDSRILGRVGREKLIAKVILKSKGAK
jgi:signal peptidase I